MKKIILLILLLTSSFSHAVGIGVTECKNYLKGVENESLYESITAMNFLSYSMGFFTAMNIVSQSNDTFDNERVDSLHRKYCSMNPESSYSQAAFAVYLILTNTEEELSEYSKKLEEESKNK
jgi:hypothetical protein